MLSLPIKPHIRLVLLMIVFLALFFSMVNLLNALASQNVGLNDLRRQTASARSDQSNYRDEATRNLNEQLVVQSNNENLQRVNTDELIKIRNIQQNTSTNTQVNQSPNSNAGNPSLVSR